MKNYLVTFWRNLRKNGVYSLLNIVGLGIGIACAILSLLWVENELNFDHQFPHLNNIYEVMDNQTYSGKTFTFGATPGLLAQSLKAEVPGMVNTTATSWGDKALFSRGDKAIFEQGLYVDSNFFSIFQWPFVRETRVSIFSQVHAVVISEKMAKEFFGKQDPVGRVLKMDNYQGYTVAGVIKDFPENCYPNGDWFVPFDNYMKMNPWLLQWGNNGILTYGQLKNNVDPARINKQIYGFVQTKDKDAVAKIWLFPLDKLHLYSDFENGKSVGGEIKFVRLFILIAWIILAIACINFMNLATARSEHRSREVGIRKTLGSGKGRLIGQFLSEAMGMSLMAVMLAILVVFLFLPAFSNMIGHPLSFNPLTPAHLVGLLAIWLFCGITAGSYPAFYLSSFRPIRVLKGVKIGGRAGFIRKGLVILQFSISIILVISVLIIFRQLQHVKNRDLGYNKENLLYTPLRGDMAQHFEGVKDQLVGTGLVQESGMGQNEIFDLGSNGGGWTWPGKNPSRDVLITQESISPGYIGTLGMNLRSGRDFYTDAKLDSNNIIINQTLANLMGKEGRVGALISRDSTHLQVVGIVSDFIYNNMYQAPAPLIFFCAPSSAGWLYIRFRQGADLNTAVSRVSAIIRRQELTFNAVYPFEYYFADNEFDHLFKTETLFGELAEAFAALAIFISCLGLLGLAAFTAERRTREIGIRKVLGASVTNLMGMLSAEFLILVVLSFVLAFPLSYLMMHGWLQQYPYRISIGWWVFALAGTGAILITFITVSVQAFRAAVINPVESLRTE